MSNSDSNSSVASGNDAGDLVLSDIEGYYVNTRTGRYYRLASSENMVSGIPNWSDLVGAPAPPVNSAKSTRAGRYDWRDYLEGPVLRRRHPERIENLPFQRLLQIMPYERVDSITVDKSVTALQWKRYGAQRVTRTDLRKRADMGDFKYASHMVACYEDENPVIFSVLKRRGSDGNHIGVVRIRAERSSSGRKEARISHQETRLHSICDGVVSAFTVRNIMNGEAWQRNGHCFCAYVGIVPFPETGSKVARCIFDNSGELIQTHYMKMVNTVKSVTSGPMSAQAIVGTENSLLLYDFNSKLNVWSIPFLEPVQAVACKDYSYELFAASGRQGILALDIREGISHFCFGLDASHCCSMQLVGDDRHLITSHFGGDLLVYDLRMRRPVDAYKEHVNTTNWTLPVAVDIRDRTVAAAGSDGVIRVWSLHSAELFASLKPPYRVREECQVPRFVHGDSWCGNARFPAVLACWMNVMQLSELSAPQVVVYSDDE
ncbi:hypothetical protein M514_01216 [Trichuris suis]|uniref:WD domain, G-beta repeat protein n=1 Tax=Trichuris suis TaxID=68888 RepID=A0A085NMY5_9BILA|nr:hypothetical protein M514_01216 [Trichuris suis]